MHLYRSYMTGETIEFRTTIKLIDKTEETDRSGNYDELLLHALLEPTTSLADHCISDMPGMDEPVRKHGWLTVESYKIRKIYKISQTYKVYSNTAFSNEKSLYRDWQNI